MTLDGVNGDTPSVDGSEEDSVFVWGPIGRDRLEEQDRLGEQRRLGDRGYRRIRPGTRRAAAVFDRTTVTLGRDR